MSAAYIRNGIRLLRAFVLFSLATAAQSALKGKPCLSLDRRHGLCAALHVAGRGLTTFSGWPFPYSTAI
jgi:hypothetical protein